MDRKELIEMLNAIKNSPDGYFGIRSENYKYEIGDICFNSRQLYQDPVYDITNELVYPYIEDGIYAGFYDGGELDGTSVTQIGSLNLHEDFLEEDLETLNNAIKENEMYYDGEHRYIVSGTDWNDGNDYNEIILTQAEVIYIIK